MISLSNHIAEIIKQLLQELIFRVDLLFNHIEKRLFGNVLILDVLIQIFMECIHVSTVIDRKSLLGIDYLIVECVELDHFVLYPLDLK